MARLGFSTLQANRGIQGNFSTGHAVDGIGVGIYVGAVGDVVILTKGGDTVKYTAVPAGTFMQTPLFTEVTSATTSTDIAIAYASPPYA